MWVVSDRGVLGHTQSRELQILHFLAQSARETALGPGGDSLSLFLKCTPTTPFYRTVR